MIIVQCDAMISLVDDIYYSRAWCSVEIMVIQKLKRAYGLHLWYEQVPLGSDKDEPGWPQKYELREGNIDFPIVLSEKHLTFESDRSRILFLERQMKLLT